MVAESGGILSRMRRAAASRRWSWILLPPAVLATAIACRSAPPRAITPDAATANNHAVGLMGQFDFEGAVHAFEAVGDSAPGWPGARLNLAIAMMNRQGPDDSARAEAMLRELAAV